MKLEELEKKYAELGAEIEALQNKPEYDYDLAIKLGCLFIFSNGGEGCCNLDRLYSYYPESSMPFRSLTLTNTWKYAVPVKERGHVQLHDGSAECPVPDVEGVCVITYDVNGNRGLWETIDLPGCEWTTVKAFVWL